MKKPQPQGLGYEEMLDVAANQVFERFGRLDGVTGDVLDGMMLDVFDEALGVGDDFARTFAFDGVLHSAGGVGQLAGHEFYRHGAKLIDQALGSVDKVGVAIIYDCAIIS